MTKFLLFGLVALVVGMSAATLAWRAYAPSPGETAPALVADAPAARDLFPKVLNR